ncbi:MULTISPECIES: alginate export family protein [unclassified Roseibium]|uniref:alginate export family protein n=1 Tax=unclassified Roseibium TaxID=2629323 RepID=UPI00273D809B|nr:MULTISPECIES: alginate export family protein [unclassified Roseibium]
MTILASDNSAAEWNETIDMFAWGGRLQAGHIWSEHSWLPSLTYTYKTFSGDDPATSQQERFDPLYYDGSPSSWATGSKSSMTFINSNVQAHAIAFNIKPTKKNSITLRYAHIRANELRSPIQFGQATRFEIAGGDNIVAGVTDHHLADDFFLEFSHGFNRNAFLTAGLSASFPGKGLDLAANRDLPVWYGGFLNLVINY